MPSFGSNPFLDRLEAMVKEKNRARPPPLRQRASMSDDSRTLRDQLVKLQKELDRKNEAIREYFL